MDKDQKQPARKYRKSSVSAAKWICGSSAVVFMVTLIAHSLAPAEQSSVFQVISGYILSALSLIIGCSSLWYIASLKHVRLSLSLVKMWQNRINTYMKAPMSETNLSDEESNQFNNLADEILWHCGQDEDINTACQSLKTIIETLNNRKIAYEKLDLINNLLNQKL